MKSSRDRGKEESRIMEGLSKRFPREDIYFEKRDDTITAHLRALDLEGFRSELEELESAFPAGNEENSFRELLAMIEGIRSYGIRGGKRVFVGYDGERKVRNRGEKEKNRGAYFYARGNHYSNENREVPDGLKDLIACADSEKYLKKLPTNSVDLILTSPPYNFGLDYDSGEDGIDWNLYFDKLFGVFDQCVRVLKHGGRIVVDIQPLFSDYIPSHHIISNFFMGRRLIWKGEITWEKNNYNCKYTAWGSWKSPSSPYLKYTHEFLEVFAKGSLKKEGRKEDIDITAEEFKNWVVARWSIAPERNMEKYDHPAMFPEELASRVIKLFSFRGDLVMDPFNGAGTTTCVAKRLGRRFLGIDISSEYCRKARERLKSCSAKKP